MKVVGRQWSVVRGLRRLFCVGLALAFYLSPFTSQAQGVPAPQRHTVIFESKNGESFTVFMDGDAVNRIPQGRVTVNDVSYRTHEVVVVLRRPEQKAAVLQLLPGEPVVTVYVDYDMQLEQMTLYTPSYNLAERRASSIPSGPSISSSSSNSSISSEDTVARDSDGVRLVTEADLAAMMLRMKNQPFDSDRLALGKVIVASASLTADQIGKLVSLLDYSASQVELLKYAFVYCVDPQNYYKAIDVLTFNGDKRKVMDYIATQ